MQVQTKDYPLAYQAGTAEVQDYYNSVMHFFRTLHPFIQKWGDIHKDFDAIYQQTLHEMQQSTFHSIWHLRSAWGAKDSHG